MSELDGLDVRLLEPLLREFVGHIGLADTMAIVRRYGGRQLYIGQDGSPLQDLIGEQKAALIGRHYGGDRPLIPKALRALRHLRDAQLRARLTARRGVRQVALELGIGERRAWQILSAGDAPGGADDEQAATNPNLRLFD